MTKQTVLCVILVMACASTSLTQEARLTSALEAFKSSDWDRCLSLLANAPSLAPEEALLLCKTYQKKGWNLKAIECSGKLIEAKRFENEARWLKAQSHYERSEYESCLSELIILAETNHTLAARATAQIDLIATHSLRLAELKTLMNPGLQSNQRDRLRAIYVARLRAAGRVESAARMTAGWLRTEPRNPLLQQIDKSLRGATDGPAKIGLVVSLSGQNVDVGRAVLRGVELAVQDHNKSSSQKVELAIVDDHSDIVHAIKAVQTLVSDDAVSAIIGPVESDHVAAVAAIVDQSRIPLISPTATRNELTSLSSFVYQANVNIETRGEALARYATRQLGLKTFAVLSPVDLYGDVVSQQFIRAAKQSGGRVVAYERYYDNTTDFRAQMTTIRKLGFVSGVLHDWTYDATNRYRMNQVDSVYAVHYPIDSLSADRELDRPMSGIEAVFLPAYTDDIKYLGPQMAFYNIRTKLLGGQNWYDLTELRLHQKYINGVVFVSDFYLNSADPEHSAFVDKFSKAFGNPPSRESYYGYDLMCMMAELIDRGDTSSEEIHMALKSGIDFKGLHNRITFRPGSQTNTSVQLLQFLNGQINKLSN